MATGDSLSGDNTTIWFAPVDTVGSDLAANAAEFQSYFSNFDEGGAEKDTESVSVFSDTGNFAFITRRKPDAQREISFDVVLRHDTRLPDFKKIYRREAISADGAGSDFVVRMIAIQNTDGDGNYYYQAYNNVDAVQFETEFSSDEEWRGTMSFKLNTGDENGISNEQEGNADVTSDLTAWS